MSNTSKKEDVLLTAQAMTLWKEIYKMNLENGKYSKAAAEGADIAVNHFRRKFEE